MDVKVAAFEGPMDLLVHLIRRSEIDIYDIPIAQITEEYLAVVATLPPDMEQMSEFLVMAATLLEIKSKMLLPRPKLDGEPEDDPREALAQQILAYQRTQELAEKLAGLTPVGERLGGPGDAEVLELLSDTRGAQPVMDLISLSHLAEIFSDILSRADAKIDRVRAGYGTMPKEKFSVTEKISFIRNTLQSKSRLKLSALFLDCKSRREMVVTFLALLEMMRRGLVLARQSRAFSDVELCAA